MSLLSEYCRRHNSTFVMPTNDGLCFFNDHKRPAVVCLTSVAPKSHLTCPRCGQDDSWITLELFVPKIDEHFTCTCHEHIHPDTDILSVVKKTTFEIPFISPVSLKHGREIEIWLWNFFLFHSRLRRSRSWVAWAKAQSVIEEPLHTYEQMTHCALNFPKVFNGYYAMYQTLISGRKYLIFE